MEALFYRECGFVKASSGSCRFFRIVYRAIVPNGGATLDVKLPNIIIRRFTPDGKYLVCFSQNQKDLVVYRYVGPHFCTKGPVSDIESMNKEKNHSDILNSFEHFFSLHFQRTVALRSEILCKTFCIAGLNGTCLIVASWSPPQASSSIDDRETVSSTSRERPALNFVPCLEKLSLHTVNVETGCLCDSWSLRDDFVDLENHSGVHLLEDTLLVLSLRFQKLHILKLLPSGMLVPFKEIGPHCFEDDSLVIAQMEERERRFRLSLENHKWFSLRGVHWNFEPEEVLESRVENTGLGNGMASRGFYAGLMHRILTYFYTHSMYSDNVDSNSRSQFFDRFQDYTSFVILKAQLLDTEHIILRLARAEDAQRAMDPSLMTFFLGFYNMTSTHFAAILSNNHSELAKIVENHSSKFLHTCMSSDFYYGGSSPTIRYRFLLGSDRTSKEGGNWSEHTVKRILSSIPCSCQVFHHSPYLDRKLFSFDESKFLALQGYKMIPCSDTGVIKFTLSSGGPLRFKLRSDFRPQSESAENWKRLTSFLFHPIFPFVINMQQSLLEPLQINFYYHLE
ncbi:Light-mediated development protein DET1 [Galdieria sulphuraria]|nr:Light-mediated development protein DET1 [Galdieria sulphuraria]